MLKRLCALSTEDTIRLLGFGTGVKCTGENGYYTAEDAFTTLH